MGWASLLTRIGGEKYTIFMSENIYSIEESFRNVMVLMGKYTKYVTEMYSDDMGWIKEAQDRDK
jgi:hypothetical protein